MMSVRVGSMNIGDPITTIAVGVRVKNIKQHLTLAIHDLFLFILVLFPIQYSTKFDFTKA